MRKRINGKRAVKVLSCANGRIIRYAMMIMCVMCLMSCAHKSGHRRKPASPAVVHLDAWRTYCEKYGVDSLNPTSEQENFYMDCYAGSVEEERDMTGVVSFAFCSEDVAKVVNGLVCKNTWYIVYTNESQGFDNELLAVDKETANMIKTAISSTGGKLSGYLVLDKANGVYNYNHEIE